MDRSKVISLISLSYKPDDLEQPVPVETAREVFCSVSSISAAEWFEAGRNGMKAQYRVTMFSHDYSGEEIVELEGERYGVYRTYQGRNETIELYLEKKGGVS